LAALAFYLWQPALVYRPSRTLATDPGQIPLAFESLWLTTADGLCLHAWWIPHPTPRGCILFCHGNAGNIAGRLSTIAQLHPLQMDILLFDYRGYGQSAGRPSEAGTYLDADAAWEYLTTVRRIPPRRIVLLGRSLGGPVAAWLASKRPVAGLVLESTFTSMVDMARQHYPWLPTRLLTRIRYPTLDYLRQVPCPVLVAHSPDDEVVPYPHGERLLRAAPDRGSFLALRGDHGGGYLLTGAAYTEGLDQFFRAVLPPDPGS
jgi:hypothetical protein